MASKTDLKEQLAALTPERRAALAKLLAKKDRQSGSAAILPQAGIPVRPPGADLPLSAAERRWRFLARLDPSSPSYNVYHALRINREIQEDILRDCLQQLVARHEILRTSYPSDGGVMRRVISPESSIPLNVVDLSALPSSSRDPDLLRILNEETRTAFDLEAGPLMRTLLVRLAADRYILLTTAHHIIVDGQSMGIISQEWLAIAAARKANVAPALPGLRIQFADFALFENTYAGWNGHVPYWKNQLAGAPQLLELPADRPRPAVQSHRGGRCPLRIGAERLSKLRQFGREHGATLFVTGLAAFGVLLHRYSGATDMVVGSPVAGRTFPELENLIGCFARALPLRLDLSGDVPFLDLLARVKCTVQDALEHQDVPFEKLVEELEPPRTRSHTPVFQVLFSLQPDWTEKVRGPDQHELIVHNGTAMLDLTLFLLESETALDGYLEYNADLYDEPAAARMVQHFDTLLASILEDPRRALSRLPLSPALEVSNGPVRHWPPATIPEMFEEQAVRIPDRIAVVHENAAITYAEVNREANRIAHHLRGLALGPGSLVGVRMDKSPELIPALLGIMKAGAAYVPLDPQYPPERLRLIAEDARLDLVLSHAQILEDRARIDAQSPENPSPAACLNDPVYVMYTSGSTGVPKGVVIPHRALVNQMRWLQEEFPLTPADAVVQRTSLSFDLSVWEIFAPLLAGARLILPTPAETQDPHRLAGLVRRHQATVIQFVPSLLREILAGGSFDECASLRRIFSGGEALPGELARELSERLHAEIVNIYGPTETCITSTFHRCSEEPAGIVQIGRPISNTQAYVLDRNLQPVPSGARGELFLGGDGLAAGYWNRPELTTEKFLPHPFSSVPGARLYRTGDGARLRADGNLEVLGRLDNQVKVRGYRIELEEVEAALRRIPEVSAAVVLAREDRLIAYVTGSVLIGKLRVQAAVHLPEYMLPAQFVLLDQLPLAPNGKVDRRALPEPDRQRGPAAYVPPADALEARLAALWEQLLDVRPVGRHDNFFELGGHSLAALRLFAEIETEFGSAVPVASLYEAPTLEQLAAVLRAGCWSPRWTSVIALQPSGRRTPLFCAHDATGHVFIYQDLAFRLGRDQPFYAFESKGIDGVADPLRTVEQMAAHYIAEMREVQPTGPYLLGGFCFGAHIALEMAYQLAAQGESVPMLMSFNTDARWKTVRGVSDSIRLHRRRIREFHRTGALGYVAERILYRVYRSWGALAWIKAKAFPAAGRPAPAAVIRELNFQAMKRAVPRKYAGTMLYFQGSGDSADDAGRFWRDLAANFEIHETPGRGIEVLREPGVQTLAEQVEQCLARLVPR